MRRVLLACVPLWLAIPTWAAPPNADPNWPCQQIKVPELSVAAMWTGPPIDPYFATWAEDPSVANWSVASRRGGSRSNRPRPRSPHSPRTGQEI